MTISSYLNVLPQLGERVFVHDSAQLVGNVRIGDDSSVWFNAVVRGDVHRIDIGRCTSIQDLVMCHVTHKSPGKPEGSPLIVGDYVTIGHSAILHGCEIGDECLIGMGSIVMDDARIGSQVIVGAGSLVPHGKQLESGYLYVGRPVVRLRVLTDDELAFLRYSAEQYVRLKNDYLTSGSSPAG